MLLRKQHIHLWLPDLFGFKGGIQVYLAFLIEAMQGLYPDIDYQLIIKNDICLKPDVALSSNTRCHFTGKWSLPLRTVAFTTKIMGQGLWHRPNLVICTHVNFLVAAYWLKRLAGIPYWVNVYGMEAWDIQKPTLKKALHNADRIFSISSYTRDILLKEQNIDPAKISILPCTFDASNFKIATKPNYLLDRYELTPDQPIILTVARLAEVERYKGYDQIITALPHIRKAIHKVHYILVGKGDDRPRIEKLIAQLNLQDCVTLAGFVPDEQLCDYYNLCDVFAMPSKREGFGIVYLEALACGKPTLGGNQDGAIDALCHGELGALVEPDNVEVIAQTLIEILQSKYPQPILYQPEVLRQKVIETYGFDRFKQTLSQYVEEFFAAQNLKQDKP